MDQNSPSETQIELFNAGLVWWTQESEWPSDLHNSQYRRLATYNGERFLSDGHRAYLINTLWEWKAYRGIKGLTKEMVKAEFKTLHTEFKEALGAKQELFGDWSKTIGDVQAKDIVLLVELAAELKWRPLDGSIVESPVATSKLLHFLYPRIFPVTDELALGNPCGNDYLAFFQYSKDIWLGLSELDREYARGELSGAIGAFEQTSNFPFETKTVEMIQIGIKWKSK